MPARERALDVLFLLLVATLPVVLMISGLGFYLDDYNALMLMSTSDDQSLWGYYASLLSGDPKSHLRPVEYAVLAALYWLFGASPLPYQVFLAALVPLCAAMLYLVVFRLTRRRHVALGVAILFAMAPHYSSARFWVVAFSPTAVLTLYLVSLYCVLRALETRGTRLAAWAAGGCIAMLASLFVYEIALPLFAATAAYFVYRGWASRQREIALGAAAYALVLAVALVVKLGLALEVGEETSYSIAGYQGGLIHHAAYVTSGAIKINFGTYGIGLPYVVWWILDNRFSWIALGSSILVGLLVYLYLARVVRFDPSASSARGVRWPLWRELVAIGLFLIAAGYGLFVVTGQIYMTSVGIDNRVNVVPALGMAVLAVGLLLRVSDFFSAPRRPMVFGAGIAGLAAAGVLVTSTTAGYWSSAYSSQLEVMGKLERALPLDPSNTTVLLDGICPEIGPGIIFLGHYDLAGALRTKYRDTSIKAAVMTDDVRPTRHGVEIATTWVGITERMLYPYGRGLLVYDWRRDSLVPLPDPRAAREYLAESPRLDCPPPRSFVWGIRTSRWAPFA